MMARILLAMLYAIPESRMAPHYSCKVECFRSLVSDLPLECETVNMNITLMLYAFDKHGPVASPVICEALHDVSVRIRREQNRWIPVNSTTVDCNGKIVPAGLSGVSGTFQPETRDIELARDLDGLAHESLHALEHAGFVQNPGELGSCGKRRTGAWAKNPVYLRMLDEYESQVRPLTVPKVKTAPVPVELYVPRGTP